MDGLGKTVHSIVQMSKTTDPFPSTPVHVETPPGNKTDSVTGKITVTLYCRSYIYIINEHRLIIMTHPVKFTFTYLVFTNLRYRETTKVL